jgi:hypothetical protein
MQNEVVRNRNEAAEETELMINIQKPNTWSSKNLTNTKICSVVDQEFERVRDCTYFPLILK